MSEAEIKQGIEQYLQYQQNMGNLVFNRLNSGEVVAMFGDRRARIKLCQEGTPDFIVHTIKAGHEYNEPDTFYIEVKRNAKLKPTEAQMSFIIKLVEQLIPTIVVSSIDEVIARVNKG